MPRKTHYNTAIRGERGQLDAFRNKYPLLAREGLAPELAPFHEVAKLLAERGHYDDLPGMLLRLNNLLESLEDSMAYDRRLPEDKAAPTEPLRIASEGDA